MEKLINDVMKVLSDDEIKQLSVSERLKYYDQLSEVKIGIEEGIEQGKEIGIEQGIKQEKKEVVVSSYECGLSIEQISKIVKMPINEVEEILKIK